ncbi:hypothetical protein JW926_08095 [Candidatus Sumerlaeota bacterium]|nr:hypothetical protein [Candidatus Sumerlaeota bacterium]
MRNLKAHKREAEIALFMILATLILGFVIYIRGYLTAPPGRFFIGHPHVKDSTTYFAKMLQGSKKGIIYYRNHLTTEPHQEAILFNFFLAMGKIAALFHIKLITMFHLSRVFWGALLLAYLYLLSFKFFKKSYERIGVMTLCCFSSGLPALEDANIFRSISIYPHFPAAMFFLLTYYYNFWKFTLRQTSRIPVFLCSLALFMIGIIHPWHFLPMSLVSLAIIVFLRLRGKSKPTGFLITGYLIMMIIPAGFAILYIHTYLTNETFQKVSRQNVIQFKSIWEFLKTYGILWIPALGGAAIAMARNRKSSMPLHAIWLLITLIIMMFPLSFQGRLIEGLHIPVCFLTMYFLVYISYLANRKYGFVRKRTALAGIIIILAFSLYTQIKFLSFPAKQDFIFPDKFPFVEVVDFMKWCPDNLPENANVLASWETSQLLARTVMVNTFACHPIETVDFYNKLSLVFRFFSGKTGSREMDDFLIQNKIDYVVHDLYSPFMRDFKPTPIMETYFTIDGVLTVYKVKR